MSSKELLMENMIKNRRKKIEAERQENKNKTKPQVIEDINAKREAGIITDEVADKYIGIVEDMFVLAEKKKNAKMYNFIVRGKDKETFPDMTISEAMGSAWKDVVDKCYKLEKIKSDYVEPMTVKVHRSALGTWVQSYLTTDGGKINTLQSVVGYDILADRLDTMEIGESGLDFGKGNRRVISYLERSGIDSSTVIKKEKEAEIEKE